MTFYLQTKRVELSLKLDQCSMLFIWFKNPKVWSDLRQEKKFYLQILSFSAKVESFCVTKEELPLNSKIRRRVSAETAAALFILGPETLVSPKDRSTNEMPQLVYVDQGFSQSNGCFDDEMHRLWRGPMRLPLWIWRSQTSHRDKLFAYGAVISPSRQGK